MVCEALYLVARGNTAIMVTAPTAGLAYEKAQGLGFPYTRTQGAGVRRLYTLNTIRSKGSNDDHHDSAPSNYPGS